MFDLSFSFDFLEVLGIAFAFACDAFSVGLALGTRGLGRMATFRLWFHFGLFQFFMPLIGWYVGNQIIDLIGKYGNLVASLLLLAIALKMFKESLEHEDASVEDKKDPTKGWSLITLAVATSIDALGGGVSMGISNNSILIPSVIIGLVAAIMTYVGVKLGGKLSTVFGKKIETFGSIVLLIIAIKLFPF